MRGARARALVLLLLLTLAAALAQGHLSGLPPIECPNAVAVPGQPSRVRCEEGLESKTSAALPLGVRRSLGLHTDLNSLTAEDLESLAGIGPKLARQVVEERTRRGGFESVDELAQVKGIGPARLAALRVVLEPPGR
ncbi:MAG: helix-hairpin-helix domain-containing protein [Deltaproteobacteria bacterium]|nr:helix-hairpin-helix domain-containing protein [Deltaproteobacteria bacterium]